MKIYDIAILYSQTTRQSCVQPFGKNAVLWCTDTQSTSQHLPHYAHALLTCLAVKMMQD